MPLSIPIQVNLYPGLLISDGYVHVFNGETAFASLTMTEEIFLPLYSISSAKDLQQYQQVHLEQRFIVAENGFVEQDKYFAKAFQELELIKATGDLLALHEAFFGQDTYNCELAVYINSHEYLQKILGSDVMCGADEYMYLIGKQNHQHDEDDEDDFVTERYSSAAGFQRSLLYALETLKHKLEKNYMSAEPCLTVTAAMWEYAYFRYQQGVMFKKCKKPGCEKYFALGPGGQRSRKYCDTHSK